MTTPLTQSGGPGAVSTSMPTTDAEGKPNISADTVRQFRQRAIDNRYRPIRVASRSKQPRGKQWPLGEPLDRLLVVREDELNTGILAAGLRCIDVDVDAGELVLKIFKVIQQRLPAGGLVRRRADSVRLAIVYRAAEGEPGKRSVAGSMGKVEVLGAGQQFVADGIHPSGASIFWSKDRGPDKVPLEQLPAITEEQVSQILADCEPLLGKDQTGTAPHAGSAIFEQSCAPLKPSVLPVIDKLSAGIESPNWFQSLQPQDKFAAVRACLRAIDNSTSDPREQWLRVLFAVADAAQLGCPDAEQLALNWSRGGASWTCEADFEIAWRSYKPGGIGIGSLLALAKEAGLDLAPWRGLASARLTLPSLVTVQAPFTCFADPWAEFVGPAFPVEILPPPLAKFVEAERRAMGADRAALAMAALTAVAGAIHAETRVRMADGWYERPVLWTALVGPPSSMKSPVIDKATAPLRDIDPHSDARWRQAYAAWKQQRNTQAANPGPPAPPKPSRQVIQDATPEKIAELLARDPAGSLMIHDELAGHIAGFDRYGSGAAARSFFLSCWNGGPFLKDRVGQGARDENAEIRVDNLALCRAWRNTA